MSDEIADLLDDAADVLERDGWIKGELHSPWGHCSLGALETAVGLNDDELFDPVAIHKATARVNRAADALMKATPRCWAVGSVAMWNDAEERKKQEVLDAFRLAAKTERMLSI